MDKYLAFSSLGALGLIGLVSLGLGRHQEPTITYLEGRVLRESGNANLLVDPNNNPTNQTFGPLVYVLTVETDRGTYTIDVESGAKPLTALIAAIEVGDTINFPVSRKSLFKGLSDAEYFSSDRIGRLGTDSIEIKEKARK